MDYKSLNLPSEDEMRQYLIDRNIGYDFKTNKSKIPKLKKDKLEKCYKVCVIGNNYGDISKIKYENIKDFDLFNFSFPCTDISIAGKQKGMTDINGNKTSSGLYINGIELIKIKEPKYIMIENVKNLISKKFINDFNSLINELKALGYKCYYPTKNGEPKCLNAKDYGIPQNRERIFIICVRNDIKLGFEFPKEFDNGLRLKDLLEDEVDEKYYLSKEEINKIFNWKAHQRPLERVLGKESICFTLTARGAGECHSGMILLNEYFDNIVNVDKIISADYRYDEGLRIRKEEIYKDNFSFKIRKLTPKECWRLMGFRDECFNEAKEQGISDTQLYKQAGNSIVVNVLYYIFLEIFKNKLKY